jgi:TetR/AcrR family transcriptional repressor of nem operon
VEVASRLFRQDGYRATGVDRLMSAAGLTRGGFYAHFRDKAQLLIESLELAFDESANLLERGHEDLVGEAWVRAAARRYLSLEHRSGLADGCAVPALGSEVARAPKTVQKAFARRITALIDAMADRLGGGAHARRHAIALLSSWVGAMVLSRAVGDKALGEEILAASREAEPGAGRARRSTRARARDSTALRPPRHCWRRESMVSTIRLSCPAAPPAAPPRRFGRFVLFDKVGEGGMARIFLGRQSTGSGRTSGHRQADLAHPGQQPGVLSALIEEAKLAAGLSHGNVVQVIDLDARRVLYRHGVRRG